MDFRGAPLANIPRASLASLTFEAAPNQAPSFCLPGAKSKGGRFWPKNLSCVPYFVPAASCALYASHETEIRYA